METHEAELAYQLQQSLFTELKQFSKDELTELVKICLANIECQLIANTSRIVKEIR